MEASKSPRSSSVERSSSSGQRPGQAASRQPATTKVRRQPSRANKATTGSTSQPFPSKNQRKSGNSKKPSMNHLLGFQYDGHHRHSSQSSHSPPSRNHQSRRHHQPTTRTRSRPLTREQYLQANAHFDVEASCDLEVQLVDPDIPVHWLHVLQVHLKSSELQHCPICLASPTAAKITRCGHVYCWPCLAHHLAVSEQDWAACPLCDDAVYSRDLRAVRLSHVAQPKTDQPLRFRLMRCGEASTLAHPVDLFRALPQDTAVFAAEATNTPFLRYHRLDIAARCQLYAREAAELLTLLALEGPDVFVQTCMDQLRTQWLALCPTLPSSTTLAELCALPVATDPSSAQQALDRSHDKVDTVDKVDSVDNGDKPGLNAAAMAFVPGGATTSLPFPQTDLDFHTRVSGDGAGVYFYQAADGHHVFLANINRRMLEMSFGDLSTAPSRLELKVLDLESVVVDAKLRKLPGLSHLPLHCRVYLAEVDLRHHVNEATMAAFADNLQRRKQRRRKATRETDRMALQARQRMEEEWRNLPLAFEPSVGAFPVAIPHGSPSPGSWDDVGSLSPGTDAAVAPPAATGAWANAKGVNVLKDMPTLSQSLPAKSQASKWRVATVRSRAPETKTEFDEDDPDGEYKPQAFQAAFFQDVQFEIPTASPSPPDGKKGKGKKKGGRKKQLLFSTDTRRATK
eukprot:m.144308 g.144308  ORF g.144308 m.144308 type:complete len:683 (-) comp16191_c0_seq2:197-2245(-)